jgi:2-polyprenyl-3-methyl-5-hydroxy-6-metoxy-1,4-benzoquinol methylase
MKLPSEESCKNDPFLWMLRGEDERGFFSNNPRTNQAFLVRRRFLFSVELIKKYLPKNASSLKIADFACGTGNVGITLFEEGYDVTFVDNEPKFFEYIKLKSEGKINKFILGDCSTYKSEEKFDVIFFGEAIEHMANPDKTIANLRDNLKTGGLLCLTTPNGDFVDCYEPNWNEVKHQTDRNEKLANNIGNHVCEFTRNELKSILKENGFNINHHETFLSNQISRKSILRRILPISLLHNWDLNISRKNNNAGKNYGRTQIILAQRAH